VILWLPGLGLQIGKAKALVSRPRPRPELPRPRPRRHFRALKPGQGQGQGLTSLGSATQVGSRSSRALAVERFLTFQRRQLASLMNLILCIKGTGGFPLPTWPGCSTKDELRGHDNNRGVKLPNPGNSNPGQRSQITIRNVYRPSALRVDSQAYSLSH